MPKNKTTTILSKYGTPRDLIRIFTINSISKRRSYYYFYIQDFYTLNFVNRHQIWPHLMSRLLMHLYNSCYMEMKSLVDDDVVGSDILNTMDCSWPLQHRLMNIEVRYLLSRYDFQNLMWDDKVSSIRWCLKEINF